MNVCDRCESKEVEKECRACSGKPDDVVYYCAECSSLVHVGRTLSKHEVKDYKTKFQSQLKDVEEMLESHQRSLESLKLRKKEIENAVDNVQEQQRVFERALRESVFRAQEKIMEHAKEFRNSAKMMITKKEEQLQSCLRECDSMISRASQTESEARTDIQRATGDESKECLQNLTEKLRVDNLMIDKGSLNTLFVGLPVVDYSSVIDTINNMDFSEISDIENRVQTCQPIPAPARNDFETSLTVSSQITNKGTFWAVPVLDEQTSLRLSTMNLEIRKNYITDSSWKTYSELRTTPSQGDKVLFRYKMDRKWYRGLVEKADVAVCEVRFLDFGTIHTTNYESVLPYSDKLFASIPGQAVHCCLFDKELETPIQNEARWHFGKLTGDWVIKAHFKHQIEVEGKLLWFVELTYLDEETSSTVSIRSEVEKKNEQVSRPREAVISCTDVRLLDNPDVKFVTTSKEPSSVESKNVDSEEVYLDALAQSLVDNVIMSSAQMLVGCENTDEDVANSNATPEIGIEAQPHADEEVESRNTDTDFGHLLNAEAPAFELNESIGFSPGITNKSGSFNTPTDKEDYDLKENYSRENKELAQFWEAFQELGPPPKDKDTGSRPRTPRPILGKVCKPESDDSAIRSGHFTSDPKLLSSETSGLLSENSPIYASSMENLFHCPEESSNQLPSKVIADLGNICYPTLVSGGDCASIDEAESDKPTAVEPVWVPEVKKFEENTKFCVSPNPDIASIEEIFRTNDNVNTEFEIETYSKTVDGKGLQRSLDDTTTGPKDEDAEFKSLTVNRDDDSQENLNENTLPDSKHNLDSETQKQVHPVSAEDLSQACNAGEINGNFAPQALWEGVEAECEVISQLEENGSFYVRILKKDAEEQRRKCQNELNEMGKISRSVSGKDFGLVEDRGNYYRAQCRGKPDNNGRCIVLLIDEGKTMRVAVSDMKEAPDRILNAACQARLVSIATESCLTFCEEERRIFHNITSRKSTIFSLKVTRVNRNISYVELNEVNLNGHQNVLIQIRERVSKFDAIPQINPQFPNRSAEMLFTPAGHASPVKVVAAPLQHCYSAVSEPSFAQKTQGSGSARPYVITSNAVNVQQCTSAPPALQVTYFNTTCPEQRPVIFTTPVYKPRVTTHTSSTSRLGPTDGMPRLFAQAIALTTAGPSGSLKTGNQMPEHAVRIRGKSSFLPPSTTCYSYQFMDTVSSGNRTHQLRSMRSPSVTSSPVAILSSEPRAADSTLRCALLRQHGPNAYGSYRPVGPTRNTNSERFRRSSPPALHNVIEDHGQTTPNAGPEIAADSGDSCSTTSLDKENAAGDITPTKQGEEIVGAKPEPSASGDVLSDPTPSVMDKQDSLGGKRSYAQTAARVPTGDQGWQSPKKSPTSYERKHSKSGWNSSRWKQDQPAREHGHMQKEYPRKEWYSQKDRPRKDSSRDVSCYNCGEHGHWKNECPNQKYSPGWGRASSNFESCRSSNTRPQPPGPQKNRRQSSRTNSQSSSQGEERC